MNRSILGALALTTGMLISMDCAAWWAGGGHGGYYHGGGGYYHGGYHYNQGWGAPGVTIGVPVGAYYGYGCSLVQRCYANGCVNTRVCN